MTHVSSMLETYPKDLAGVDREKLAACIAACFECAQVCTACADACLAEDMVQSFAPVSAPTWIVPTSVPPPARC